MPISGAILVYSAGDLASRLPNLPFQNTGSVSAYVAVEISIHERIKI